MEIKHLLKSQSNQVFEALKSVGYEPSDFEWEDATGPLSGTSVSQLVHKASKFYFVFDNSNGRIYSKWSPGNETLTQSEDTGGWQNQSGRFAQWLSYLKRETESPNLWEAISNEARILESAASSDTSNVPFTAEEKAYILNGVNEVKQYLLTAHRVDPELVESRLSYLIESSERLGRKDWLNLLVSVLVSIAINAALPPETIREVFRFVGEALRQIIRTPLLLT